MILLTINLYNNLNWEASVAHGATGRCLSIHSPAQLGSGGSHMQTYTRT